MTDLCAECGGGFTAAEWELRHSRTDGEDIHDHCCDCGKGPTRLTQIYRNGAHVDGRRASVVGDCFRTALACILGAKHPTQVPHFTQIDLSLFSLESPSHVDEWAHEWMADLLGVGLATFNPATLTATARANGLPLYSVATVPGHRANWHSVVWEHLENRLYHDPTPDGTRIWAPSDLRYVSAVVLETDWSLGGQVHPLISPWEVGSGLPAAYSYPDWESPQTKGTHQ